MRALVLVVLVACTRPSSPQPVSYDAGGRDGLGTPIGNTCAHLRSLGCPEGFTTKSGRTCFEHLSNLDAIAVVPYACLDAASSPESVRECGDDTSVRVLCYMPSSTEAGSSLP